MATAASSDSLEAAKIAGELAAETASCLDSPIPVESQNDTLTVPFDPKRAGLVIRDAATVLCGTLLVEFIMEQANCLEKRLKPVLEVLPGVERELEGFECDWRGMREDIETLLEACARFKADPPAAGVCDYLAELYETKKRAYNQLRALKSTIAARVRAAEEAAIAACLAEEAAQAMRQVAEEEYAARAAADALARLSTESVGGEQLVDFGGGGEELEKALADGAAREERGVATDSAGVTPDDPYNHLQYKAEKKKKKKAKKPARPTRVLLTARPGFPVPVEDLQEHDFLGRTAEMLLALWDKERLDRADIEVARSVLSASASFPWTGSPAILDRRALAVVAAASILYAAMTPKQDGASWKEVMVGYGRASALTRLILERSPEDDFRRWDLVYSNHQSISSALASNEEVSLEAAQEAVDHLRILHPHRRHYARYFSPFVNVPDDMTCVFASCLGHLAIALSASDPVAALRCHEEVLALPAWDSPSSDMTSNSRAVRHFALNAQSSALLAVARARLQEGLVANAIAAATSGVTAVRVLIEAHEYAGWTGTVFDTFDGLRKVAVDAWALEEKHLAKLVVIRSGVAKARKSNGIPETEEQKEEMKRIRKDLDAVRDALKEMRSVKGIRAGT